MEDEKIVLEYIQKRSEVIEMKSRLRQLTADITELAEALKYGPQSAYVDDLPNTDSLITAARNAGCCLDRRVPAVHFDPLQFNHELTRLHEKQGELYEIWERLDPKLREALARPTV